MEEKKIIEEQLSVSEQENVNDSSDYIEAIKEMKQNSVRKEAYDKLKAENQQLLDAIINGTELTQDIRKREPADIKKLRNKLFKEHPDMSNLEYVKTALELREALIENGERDPFLPSGEKILPTNDDVETAERVAKIMKDCVDYADGNSAIFTNELQRVTIDASPIRRK